MSRHALSMGLGVVGAFLSLSPFYMNLPSQFELWRRQQDVTVQTGIQQIDLKGTEETERTRIEQRAQTSKEARKAGIARPGRTLKMAAYIWDADDIPVISTRGYLDTDTIYTYDSSGFCFGKIQNRQLITIKDVPNICNGK